MTAEHESWDSFWDEVTGGERTEVIRGVRVAVPTDVPLAFEKRREELADSDAFEDYAELVGMLFGGDVLSEWVEAGMGLRELQTVFTWGMAQGSGEDMTFRQAYELVQSRDNEDGEGKAPAGANRATRRAAQKQRSANTGGRSKRTSSANTG